jgi:BlaR1 peptidase M56
MHCAATRMRIDQELACDAAVIAARPAARRVYAEALLKTQIAPVLLPLGCTWTSRSAKCLDERIRLLAQPALGRWRRALCALVIAGLGFTLGYTAWAQQPQQQVTRMMGADAPDGMLSPIEKMRHERALGQAQAGNIDFVLFGTTNTEMWLWPDRGRPVWDKAFGTLKGENFGSQGTRPESLLWRMQNGELDGYQAKLVVLSAFDPIEAAIPDSDRANYVEQHARIIAEIKKRQPKARILIFANIPRGTLTHEQWQAVAATNAAVIAPLIDNNTVFYADIGERFYQADGSHNQAMWARVLPPNAGIQASGFEAWAEALKPWLDRFVR